MSVYQKTIEITLLRTLYLVAICHLPLAAIAAILVGGSGAMNWQSTFWIVGPYLVLGLPGTALFAWMIAKGSNWQNTKPAIAVACVYPLKYYVVIVTLFVGGRVFGLMPALLLTLGVYLVVRRQMMKIGEYLVSRLAPDIWGQNG